MDSDKGFTLIELLLAISLTAIIAGVIFYTFSSVVNTADHYLDVADEYHTARLVLMKISDEINSAVFFDTKREDEDTFFFIGENDTLNGLPADRLRFTAAAGGNGVGRQSTGDLIEVEYYIEEDIKYNSKVLYRRFDAVIDGFFDTEPAEFAEGITGIDYIFYDESGEEREEWNSMNRGEEERKLPRAVKIILIFGDEQSGIRKYSTISSLMVDA